jgi:hypothetical protein
MSAGQSGALFVDLNYLRTSKIYLGSLERYR